MAVFKPRTTKPEAGNKYYITKAKGGYSGAIQGKPTDPDCDVLSNCVGYAYGRFNEIGGYGYCKYLSPVNAENFIQYAGGLEVGQIPKLGACMVWKKGATLSNSDGAGHVAIVEKIISSTQIVTSESGWNSSAFWTKTRNKGNGNWGAGSGYTFLGFIYNPAPCCKSSSAEVSISKLDVDGKWGSNTTIASQKVMGTTMDGIISNQPETCKKYLPAALETSWKFKKAGCDSGSELIRAIQKLVGAEKDGHCGKNTVTAIQKFLKAGKYYTGRIDGIMGKNTVIGWQKYLNSRM